MAGWFPLFASSAVGGPTGAAQINLGSSDYPGAFMNFMKTYQSQDFPTGTSPGDLDDNGYPKTTLGNNIGGAVFMPAGFAGDAVPWVLANDGSRKIQFVINAAVTKTAQTGAGTSVTGGGGGSMTVTFDGPGTVTFNFNSFSGPSFSFYFPSGFANVTGTGELSLVRSAGRTAYLAGAIFTPEFVSSDGSAGILGALDPKTIRPMGWSHQDGNQTNQVQWRYRTTTSCLSYINPQFPNNTWAGAVTGTDSTFTIPAATDTTLAGPVDGETIQGRFTNAATFIQVVGAASSGGPNLVRLEVDDTSTLTTGQSVWISGVRGTTEANGLHTVSVIDSTHIDLPGVTFAHSFVGGFPPGVVGTAKLTVTGQSGSAKFIGTSSGKPLFSGFTDGPAAGSLATFVYDGLLGIWRWSEGGISGSTPIEVQVALANLLRSHLWVVIPSWFDDTAVSSMATVVRDNLATGLNGYFEYGNEIWNFLFAQTLWAYQRGLALGFPDENAEPLYGWYGLRTRQIMGIITTLWGARAGLKRVLAFQAFGNTGGTVKYRMEGFDLNSANFPTYGTYTGGVDYDTSPNRPVDYADVLSYATYYQGAYFNDGFHYTAGAMPTAGITSLTSMATNYKTGAVSTAKAALNADIRTGTNSNEPHPQTLADLNAAIYPTWETVAAGYVGKTVELYEGGLQCVPPTAEQCTDLGITDGVSAASAAQSLADLLAALKNDAAFAKSLLQDQFNQFLAQSHSRNPSWLNLTGLPDRPNPWSLMPGDIFSTPYQLYDGFKEFH